MNPVNQQIVLATPSARMGFPTFPKSIQRRIFDFYIQGPAVLPPPKDSDERQVLILVCKEWQGILESTPGYWNAIDFAQQAAKLRPNDLIRLTECFLSRSGNNVLSVRFRDVLQSNVGRHVFESVVRPHAQRISFFSCTVTKETLRLLFGWNPVRFPMLRGIDVGVIRDFDEPVVSSLVVGGSLDITGFQYAAAPRLRAVVLRILGGVHPDDMRLSWGRLTRIDLADTCVLVHKFMKIARECVFLERGTFCIDFTRYFGGQPTRLRMVLIPRLRSLRLRLVQPSKDGVLFGSLRAPVLEELCLEREEIGQGIRDMVIYETLLKGVNPNLKRLVMAEYTIPMTRWFVPRLNRSPRMVYQRLDGVLRSCQNLTFLFLGSGVFIHPLDLDRMATGDFLPRLERLGVSSVSGWDIIWMVQRRNLASRLPEFPASGPSSSPMARNVRPVALNRLRLCVMGCGLGEADVQKLEDAGSMLALTHGFLLKPIDIADARNPF